MVSRWIWGASGVERPSGGLEGRAVARDRIVGGDCARCHDCGVVYQMWTSTWRGVSYEGGKGSLLKVKMVETTWTFVGLYFLGFLTLGADSSQTLLIAICY